MATNSNPFADGILMKDGPIPIVDPADLKSVWAMQEDVTATHPGQQIGIASSLYERACTTGANVQAVFFRVSMLRVLKMMTESDGLILPWLHDGKPEDALFKVLAAMPMNGLPPGGRQGLPFDVEEFRRLLNKESEG
jgi:hypothetical protein